MEMSIICATILRLIAFTSVLEKTKPGPSGWSMLHPANGCRKSIRLAPIRSLFNWNPRDRIFTPDLNQIAVIHRQTGVIERWPLTLEQNFPMAMDEANHGLFVVTHQPPRLALFDTNNGRAVAESACAYDADEAFYDAGRKRIYVPEGKDISAFFNRPMPTIISFSPKFLRPEAPARPAIFGKGRKGFDRFFLGVPARAAHGAEIWIYTVQDRPCSIDALMNSSNGQSHYDHNGLTINPCSRVRASAFGPNPFISGAK
jgi:hypothetical protein